MRSSSGDDDEDEGEDEDTPAAPPASANRDGLLAPLSRLLDLTEHMQTLTLTLPRSLLTGSAMPTSTTTESTGVAGRSAWPHMPGSGHAKTTGLTNRVRKLVSLKKRRFVGDGFDLDLTYITPRVIAMGFPSEGAEGVYRNPMSEVVSFLETRHREHYMVYNLCSERSYEAAKFSNRVRLFPFDDHTPPPLRMILAMCANVKQFLDEDDENVVAIHCKAGKGRTGTMICAYLLFSREFATADGALDWFAFMRTHNRKGVTIPSQIRYVHYTEKILPLLSDFRHPRLPPANTYLRSVHLSCVPSFDSRGSCDPYLQVHGGFLGADVVLLTVHCDAPTFTAVPVPTGHFECGYLELEGDFKVIVFDGAPSKKRKMFSFWAHVLPLSMAHPLSMALPLSMGSGGSSSCSGGSGGSAPEAAKTAGERIVKIGKAELDSTHDAKHTIFPADFEVELCLCQALPVEVAAAAAAALMSDSSNFADGAPAGISPDGAPAGISPDGAPAGISPPHDDDDEGEGEGESERDKCDEGGAKAPSAGTKAAAPPHPTGDRSMAGLLNSVVTLRPLRQLVSKNKRRFVGDGVDLDLTYITPRVIAMGFPSEGAEGVYRNPMSEVVSFLETRHREHYMVYNLCSERSYEAAKFSNRVRLFPFDDHTPPPLRMMGEFCRSAQDFLQAHPSNVVAIHCKAGKGRTGVMVAAFLLHDRFFTAADDALAFYAFARTSDCEGVTIPSQRAYVHYYASLCSKPALQQRLLGRPLQLQLVRVRLVMVPLGLARHAQVGRHDQSSPLRVTIHSRKCHREWSTRRVELSEERVEGLEVDEAVLDGPPAPFRSSYARLQPFSLTNSRGEVIGKKVSVPVVSFVEECPIPIEGDVRIEIGYKDIELFHFWFDAAMLADGQETLVRRKWHLDGLKDAQHKKFDPNFRVELKFQV